MNGFRFGTNTTPPYTTMVAVTAGLCGSHQINGCVGEWRTTCKCLEEVMGIVVEYADPSSDTKSLFAHSYVDDECISSRTREKIPQQQVNGNDKLSVSLAFV